MSVSAYQLILVEIQKCIKSVNNHNVNYQAELFSIGIVKTPQYTQYIEGITQFQLLVGL